VRAVLRIASEGLCAGPPGSANNLALGSRTGPAGSSHREEGGYNSCGKYY